MQNLEKLKKKFSNLKTGRPVSYIKNSFRQSCFHKFLDKVEDGFISDNNLKVRIKKECSKSRSSSELLKQDNTKLCFKTISIKEQNQTIDFNKTTSRYNTPSRYKKSKSNMNSFLDISPIKSIKFSSKTVSKKFALNKSKSILNNEKKSNEFESSPLLKKLKNLNKEKIDQIFRKTLSIYEEEKLLEQKTIYEPISGFELSFNRSSSILPPRQIKKLNFQKLNSLQSIDRDAPSSDRFFSSKHFTSSRNSEIQNIRLNCVMEDKKVDTNFLNNFASLSVLDSATSSPALFKRNSTINVKKEIHTQRSRSLFQPEEPSALPRESFRKSSQNIIFSNDMGTDHHIHHKHKFNLLKREVQKEKDKVKHIVGQLRKTQIINSESLKKFVTDLKIEKIKKEKKEGLSFV
jgi:hypothetical protein